MKTTRMKNLMKLDGLTTMGETMGQRMKTYKVQIIEQVRAVIDLEIKATSPKEAAQLGYDAWIINGTGDFGESVEDRHVEVDGKVVEVEEEQM